MKFTHLIKECFRKWRTFHGACSRREFWLFQAARFSVLSLLGLIPLALYLLTPEDAGDALALGFAVLMPLIATVALLIEALFLMPHIAVTIRRLRDRGCSPWILLPVSLSYQLFHIVDRMPESIHSQVHTLFVGIVVVCWGYFLINLILPAPKVDPMNGDPTSGDPASGDLSLNCGESKAVSAKLRKSFFQKYLTLKGRVSRCAFWSPVLWLSSFIAVILVTPIIYLWILIDEDTAIILSFAFPLYISLVGTLYFLAIIPLFTLTVRRLHDIGRSSLMLWLLLVGNLFLFNTFNLGSYLVSASMPEGFLQICSHMWDWVESLRIQSVTLPSILNLIVGLYLLKLMTGPSSPEANKYGQASTKA